MRQQQRMEVMKDIARKTRAKGRMYANNRSWVSEMLAADCERASLHAGWEDDMQKWYDGLHELRRRMKSRRWNKNTRRTSVKLPKRADGSAGLLHRTRTRSRSGRPFWSRGRSSEEREEPKRPTTRGKRSTLQERTFTIQCMVFSVREGQRQGGPAQDEQAVVKVSMD